MGVESDLTTRNNLENLASWKCGRPSQFDDCNVDSDTDEDIRSPEDFGLGSNLTNIRDVFHRYSVDDNEEDAEDGSLFVDDLVEDKDDEDGSKDPFSEQEIRYLFPRRDGLSGSDDSDDSDEEDSAMIAPVHKFRRDTPFGGLPKMSI